MKPDFGARLAAWNWALLRLRLSRSLCSGCGRTRLEATDQLDLVYALAAVFNLINPKYRLITLLQAAGKTD